MKDDPFFELTVFFLAVGVVLGLAMWWHAATYRGFEDVTARGVRIEVGMVAVGK